MTLFAASRAPFEREEASLNSDLLVEIIERDGRALAYVIRRELSPDRTTFLTPPEIKQQVGFVVYPAGSEIGRHTHRPLERSIVGPSEVLVVKKGLAEIDVYDDDHELVAT